jgi:hypothetical protein
LRSSVREAGMMLDGCGCSRLWRCRRCALGATRGGARQCRGGRRPIERPGVRPAWPSRWACPSVSFDITAATEA